MHADRGWVEGFGEEARAGEGGEMIDFRSLDNEQQQLVRLVMRATSECLHDYAKMIESGQMEISSGADALRQVAGLMLDALGEERAL